MEVGETLGTVQRIPCEIPAIHPGDRGGAHLRHLGAELLDPPGEHAEIHAVRHVGGEGGGARLLETLDRSGEILLAVAVALGEGPPRPPALSRLASTCPARRYRRRRRRAR